MEEIDTHMYYFTFIRCDGERFVLFFQVSLSLRQGDLLSSLLFIIVMEILHKLIEKVKEVGSLRGIQIGRDANQD